MSFRQRDNPLVILFFGLLCALSALNGQAQTPNRKAQSEVIEISRESRLVQRKMSYRVILPANYQSSPQTLYPVIYLLHGRTGNYRDWSNLTKIEKYSHPYNFIIVMPDGGLNGWYADSTINPNDKYESYFIRELIPQVESSYRASSERSGRIVAGLSMGGYGAMKFALKYPEKFIMAGSFSGAFDSIVKTARYPHLVESVKSVFGGDNSPARTANDIFRIVREASPAELKNYPFLFIDCGTEDHQIQANRDFVTLLTEKKVPHEYRQMPGEHNWKFWDSEIQQFLQAANNLLIRAKTLPTAKN